MRTRAAPSEKLSDLVFVHKRLLKKLSHSRTPLDLALEPSLQALVAHSRNTLLSPNALCSSSCAFLFHRSSVNKFPFWNQPSSIPAAAFLGQLAQGAALALLPEVPPNHARPACILTAEVSLTLCQILPTTCSNTKR